MSIDTVGFRREQGRRRGYRRTRRVASAAAAALVVTVLLAPGGGAQEAAQSAPESGEIRNGRAKAVAVVSKVAPGVGNLELGMTFGTSVTQVTNDLAQATSQIGDLGLIGTSLTSEGCDGSSTVHPDQLPQATSVDNRDGDASVGRDEFGAEGSPFAAGRMQVEAVDEPPASRARTSSGAFGLPGVVEVGAGSSETVTRVLPGEGREAIATATSSLDLGEVLTLDGMVWSAHHRTGTEPLAHGSFEIGRAAMGGIPLPTDDLGAVQEAVNEALALTGISVSLPQVQRLVEPTDLVRVTPLRIELRDSPAGKTVLGPALDITRDQRVELFNSLVAAACDLASVLLVGDVGVSVLAGTGFLTVEVGGVEAASSDLEIGNPFGAFQPPIGAVPEPAPAGGPQMPGAISAGGSGSVTNSSPGAVPAAGGTEVLPPVRRAGAVVEMCESLHPNRNECSEGAAAVVGAVGILATIGMAGADVLRQRRLTSLQEI